MEIKPIFQKQPPRLEPEPAKGKVIIPSLGEIKMPNNKPGRILEKIKNWLPLTLVGLVILFAVLQIIKVIIKKF